MIQSVTFELKPCVMIVTPAAATEPVEQSASTNAPKKQRNRVLKVDAAFMTRKVVPARPREIEKKGSSDEWGNNDGKGHRGYDKPRHPEEFENAGHYSWCGDDVSN